jgi:hypothetical protein
VALGGRPSSSSSSGPSGRPEDGDARDEPPRSRPRSTQAAFERDPVDEVEAPASGDVTSENAGAVPASMQNLVRALTLAKRSTALGGMLDVRLVQSSSAPRRSNRTRGSRWSRAL